MSKYLDLAGLKQVVNSLDNRYAKKGELAVNSGAGGSSLSDDNIKQAVQAVRQEWAARYQYEYGKKWGVGLPIVDSLSESMFFPLPNPRLVIKPFIYIGDHTNVDDNGNPLEEMVSGNTGLVIPPCSIIIVGLLEYGGIVKVCDPEKFAQVAPMYYGENFRLLHINTENYDPLTAQIDCYDWEKWFIWKYKPNDSTSLGNPNLVSGSNYTKAKALIDLDCNAFVPFPTEAFHRLGDVEYYGYMAGKFMTGQLVKMRFWYDSNLEKDYDTLFLEFIDETGVPIVWKHVGEGKWQKVN